MVLDIVKQAVRTKMTCKNPSPIISEAEFCFACALALREMNQEELLGRAAGETRVEEIQALILPMLREQAAAYEEVPPVKRLIELLISSRVQGEVSEEIRPLLQ